jgi:hypothetical protein
MTSLKEEAARIILESAKKREKKTAKPIPHEDIGDPNQKGFACEDEQIDELSKSTLERYKVKAKRDAIHSFARGNIVKTKKRLDGIDKAKNIKESNMTNNFNLTDSLIDAVKKIHDDEVEKQAASASDTEEKNAQFLVDQAERIAKYSKQVFGEVDEEIIGNMAKLAKEKKKLKVNATKSYIKVAKEKASERKVKEEVEPEDQIDEKYLGFKKLKGKLSGKGVSNHGAVAAKIGMAKYGKKKFEKAAHEHKKMKGMKHESVEYIEENIKNRIIEKVMAIRNRKDNESKDI